MTDLFHTLTVASDSLISSQRKSSKSQSKVLVEGLTNAQVLEKDADADDESQDDEDIIADEADGDDFFRFNILVGEI